MSKEFRDSSHLPHTDPLQSIFETGNLSSLTPDEPGENMLPNILNIQPIPEEDIYNAEAREYHIREQLAEIVTAEMPSISIPMSAEPNDQLVSPGLKEFTQKALTGGKIRTKLRAITSKIKKILLGEDLEKVIEQEKFIEGEYYVTQQKGARKLTNEELVQFAEAHWTAQSKVLSGGQMLDVDKIVGDLAKYLGVDYPLEKKEDNDQDQEE